MSELSKLPSWCFHDANNICGFREDYFWLSNMALCSNGVDFRGQTYPAAESAYQAAKIEPESRIHLINCKPAETKELHKNYKQIYTPEEWGQIKYDIMREVVFSKFLLNHDLRRKLIQTGNKYLEETNYWKDSDWGVCRGVGENNLGKILMKVRDFWK